MITLHLLKARASTKEKEYDNHTIFLLLMQPNRSQDYLFPLLDITIQRLCETPSDHQGTIWKLQMYSLKYMNTHTQRRGQKERESFTKSYKKQTKWI